MTDETSDPGEGTVQQVGVGVSGYHIVDAGASSATSDQAGQIQ